MNVVVRQTRHDDYPGIARLCEAVYPGAPVWGERHIASHLSIFPEGQFVAEDRDTCRIIGMSASLVIKWDDYDLQGSWKDFTDGGMFTNHDPLTGRTLYGAEIMVDPDCQGKGVGKLLYAEREKLLVEKKLLRIRAGARLRGYGTYAEEMSAEDYVVQVIRGKVFDPTLSFQIKRGFHVLSVVSGYLRHDPDSKGYAAVIEWINAQVAESEHYLLGDPKFRIAGPWANPLRLK